MKRMAPITALFVDIGGVLLTDGWDHDARKRATTNFKLELAEMEDRAGHRPSASRAGRLCGQHPDVRADRRRLGDPGHSSHGLQVHLRETGFARIAE